MANSKRWSWAPSGERIRVKSISLPDCECELLQRGVGVVGVVGVRIWVGPRATSQVARRAADRDRGSSAQRSRAEGRGSADGSSSGRARGRRMGRDKRKRTGRQDEDIARHRAGDNGSAAKVGVRWGNAKCQKSHRRTVAPCNVRGFVRRLRIDKLSFTRRRPPMCLVGGHGM